MIYELADTICAQSTPSGRGGIHVIRVSGKESVNIVSKCFKIFEDLKSLESHKVYYGYFVEPFKGETLDEVLVTYFRKGHSFTFEDTIEISTHGNPAIVSSVLDVLVKLGCRIAERGEFSYRAYKNGRITAFQAEALLSVIESNSKSSISKSLELLQGDVKLGLDDIKSSLIWLVSRLEAKIDFSTEDIEIESSHILISKMSSIISLIDKSLKSFSSQKIIDRGIKTLVLGPPNVGKSSLFNYFVGKKRSIVSEIPGTTRDYVSEFINLQGKTFEMIDTAGIRQSTDTIETLGVSNVSELVQIADLIILVNSPDTQDLSFLDMIDSSWKSKKVIYVLNKSDLVTDPIPSMNKLVASFSPDLFMSKNIVSVKDQTGLDSLINSMSLVFDVDLEKDPIGIVNLRHQAELEKVQTEMNEARNALIDDIGDELVLFHLNLSLKSLMNIFHIEDEEIIRDQIFKDFCLGK